ncbi:hypothetical protein D9758_017409 [Tetrapyrgos nigripes]|uniref:Uncharacterized protein n=1 Tax=Tetrapyrgos nigripes TaxID=182062 RepID=A0A8H5C4W1_9AGAR|nr:hypothetical protein D9758_017409 [Tetrapyrgos nigripes]
MGRLINQSSWSEVWSKRDGKMIVRSQRLSSRFQTFYLKRSPSTNRRQNYCIKTLKTAPLPVSQHSSHEPCSFPCLRRFEAVYSKVPNLALVTSSATITTSTTTSSPSFPRYCNCCSATSSFNAWPKTHTLTDFRDVTPTANACTFSGIHLETTIWTVKQVVVKQVTVSDKIQALKPWDARRRKQRL